MRAGSRRYPFMTNNCDEYTQLEGAGIPVVARVPALHWTPGRSITLTLKPRRSGPGIYPNGTPRV